MRYGDLVSVVIPTYNRSRSIERAVRGVLAQTYDTLELIVVDDASSDDTVAILENICDPRLRILRQPRNAGAGAARHAGILAAQAQVIAFQDSDDEWLPEKLAGDLNDLPGLRLQEPEKQGPYKLSYYVDQSRLDEHEAAIRDRLEQLAAPYSIIASVDPFNGDGLIDLLPTGVSKAFALQWLADHRGIARQSIAFAGDSGNDTAALTAGYLSIVVNNASDTVKSKVKQSHQQNGWTNRLHITNAPATSGVLEGIKHFAMQTN